MIKVSFVAVLTTAVLGAHANWNQNNLRTNWNQHNTRNNWHQTNVTLNQKKGIKNYDPEQMELANEACNIRRAHSNVTRKHSRNRTSRPARPAAQGGVGRPKGPPPAAVRRAIHNNRANKRTKPKPIRTELPKHHYTVPTAQQIPREQMHRMPGKNHSQPSHGPPPPPRAAVLASIRRTENAAQIPSPPAQTPNKIKPKPELDSDGMPGRRLSIPKCASNRGPPPTRRPKKKGLNVNRSEKDLMKKYDRMNSKRLEKKKLGARIKVFQSKINMQTNLRKRDARTRK